MNKQPSSKRPAGVSPRPEATAKTVKKKNTSAGNEAWFAVFLICFAVVMVLLLTLIVGASIIDRLLPDDTTQDPGIQQQPPEDPGDDPDPDPVEPPVFAGGHIENLPHATDQTVTLAEELSSSFGILVDAESGVILAGKGSDTRFNPASMTKVMTLIVLCESLTESDLDREVMMTAEMRQYVTTGKYLNAGIFGYQIGDKVKIRDLLYGIGVESDADCTMMAVNALFPHDTPAEAEEKCVALMQQKVQEMGLKNTHFDNVIGHESENNYSTAADVAAIMMYALNSPVIKTILSTSFHRPQIYRLEDDGVTYARWTMNYYSSLFNNKRSENESSRIYAYEKKFGSFSLANATLLGGKTGTLGSGSATDPWNYSLVSFAQKNGKLYIAVTGEILNDGAAVMKDAKTLYENYIN